MGTLKAELRSFIKCPYGKNNIRLFNSVFEDWSGFAWPRASHENKLVVNEFRLTLQITAE